MKFQAVLGAWGLVVACLLPAAHAQGIYTCVDAKGRRITSDRVIPECLDREQKELSPSGTVRRVVGPNLTGAERAQQEERQRRLEAGDSDCAWGHGSLLPSQRGCSRDGTAVMGASWWAAEWSLWRLSRVRSRT